MKVNWIEHSVADKSLYEALVAKAKEGKQAEAEQVKRQYTAAASEGLMSSHGLTKEQAVKVITARMNGRLLPEDIIIFQDGEVETVSQILLDPEAYDRRSCADPNEPEEGTSKAMVFGNKNSGSPRIYSQLHGGINYKMQKQAKVGNELVPVVLGPDQNAQTSGDVIKELSDIKDAGEEITKEVWGKVVVDAKLNPTETDEVIRFLVSRGLGGKRVLDKQLKNYRASISSKDAWKNLNVTAGKKKLVRFDVLDMNKTVKETELGVVSVPGDWLFFSFGSRLSYVTKDKPIRRSVGVGGASSPTVPVFDAYTRESLSLRVEQSVVHYEVKANLNDPDGPKMPIHVPTPIPVINKMMDNPASRAPKVSGLVTHPVIDLDGRVVDKEGIDEDTGLLLDFGGSKFSKPKNLDKSRAKNATDWLVKALFSEFPFKDSNTPSRLYVIAALSLLMTTILRKVMDIAPGFLTSASVQGTGKTTLNRICHVITTGHDMPVTNLSENNEESEKTMLAVLLKSPEMVCFDNFLEGSELRGGAISKVITSSSFSARILGQSKTVTVPTNVTVTVTGNNVTLSADHVRRFVTIHLSAKEALPETRRFRHPDIVQHCLSNRDVAINACLSIAKSYIDAGCPLDGTGLEGSGFLQWDRMVRLPLLWATGVDVLGAIKQNRDNSSEHQAMNGIMHCLFEIYGGTQFTASKLMRIWETYTPNVSSDIQDHLTESVSNISVKAVHSSRSLAWVLKKMVGRQINGKMLMYTVNNAGNLGSYSIKQI